MKMVVGGRGASIHCNTVVLRKTSIGVLSNFEFCVTLCICVFAFVFCSSQLFGFILLALTRLCCMFVIFRLQITGLRFFLRLLCAFYFLTTLLRLLPVVARIGFSAEVVVVILVVAAVIAMVDGSAVVVEVFLTLLFTTTLLLSSVLVYNFQIGNGNEAMLQRLLDSDSM